MLTDSRACLGRCVLSSVRSLPCFAPSCLGGNQLTLPLVVGVGPEGAFPEDPPQAERCPGRGGALVGPLLRLEEAPRQPHREVVLATVASLTVQPRRDPWAPATHPRPHPVLSRGCSGPSGGTGQVPQLLPAPPQTSHQQSQAVLGHQLLLSCLPG